MSERLCFYCQCANGKGARELRPYGPGGKDICYGCMNALPEREAEIKKEYHRQLDAAGDVHVLSSNGPRPATRAERRRLIRRVK